ncbi:MAG: cell division protein ZapA [Pseudomonadota bacterium]|nr:cell division protein ZapA [Pseudomonadota bacterium]
MPVVKLIIDNNEYEIECGEGEVNLLNDAEKRINQKINEFPELKKLPESKKFLMISLMIAGENENQENSRIQNDQNLSDIELELDELEGLIDKKL